MSFKEGEIRAISNGKIDKIEAENRRKLADWLTAGVVHTNKNSIFLCRIDDGTGKMFSGFCLANIHFGGGRIMLPLELIHATGYLLPKQEIDVMIATNLAHFRHMLSWDEKSILKRIGLVTGPYDLTGGKLIPSVAEGSIEGLEMEVIDLHRWLDLDSQDGRRRKDKVMVDPQNSQNIGWRRAASIMDMTEAVEEVLRSWSIYPMKSSTITWKIR